MIPSSEIRRILADRSPRTLEGLARTAAAVTRRQFGRAIGLYIPLYLSNHCSSHCTYCGFHSRMRIRRMRLSPEQMRKEMDIVARTRIGQILLLTGESYRSTPLSYLTEAVRLARRSFPSVALEVHPLDTEAYQALFQAGADGITVYQETYDRKVYARVHLSGRKRDYDYRYHTPQRAAEGGIRQISMGILLGLADPAEDLAALYRHLRWMERRHPGVEYSVSFPRLRPVKGHTLAADPIDEVTFVQIICLTRILFPRTGINLSTREHPRLRDHLLELGVTRISAGSRTSVGGYGLTAPEEQEPQFDIVDPRSTEEIIQVLKERGFDPVLTEWRGIANAPA